MSDIKLFRIGGSQAAEIKGESATVEKSLQNLMENHCETLLGVSFLASEHTTGKTHGGRIDTLGIDESDCPVIIEYKRATNENVINQGLFYLDWLLDHKAEFKFLVLERYGKARADAIDWTAPRLLCIAGDFTRYDQHAVQQINRNIDLVRYRYFGKDLLALQLVHRTSDSVLGTPTKAPKAAKAASGDKPFSQALNDAEPAIRDCFESLRTYLLSLGDDVQEKELKLYRVYRRIKNFACVVSQKKALLIYLKVPPSSVTLTEGFTRDVSEIGHWGTGDLEVTIRTTDDLKRAEALIARSYEES